MEICFIELHRPPRSNLLKRATPRIPPAFFAPYAPPSELKLIISNEADLISFDLACSREYAVLGRARRLHWYSHELSGLPRF
ncbi:unnamed protein product, partial [Iphiclides podalirius]